MSELSPLTECKTRGQAGQGLLIQELRRGVVENAALTFSDCVSLHSNWSRWFPIDRVLCHRSVILDTLLLRTGRGVPQQTRVRLSAMLTDCIRHHGSVRSAGPALAHRGHGCVDDQCVPLICPAVHSLQRICFLSHSILPPRG